MAGDVAVDGDGRRGDRRLGLSLVFPAIGVEAVKRVPEFNRGTALGVYTAFADVSFFLVGPIAGAIIGWFWVRQRVPICADQRDGGAGDCDGAGGTTAGGSVASRRDRLVSHCGSWRFRIGQPP